MSFKLFSAVRSSRFFNFLDVATPIQKRNFGLFMWFALYFGYFVFCLNWLVFSNLEGTSGAEGWKKYFEDKGLGKDGVEVRLDAVNYSITLARGLVTVAVAWIMAKISHKRASSIALFLNTAALPLIFSPHYSLLVVGRMFMAAGGTMLIILLQPVISRFFGLRMKGILSAITPTAYIFAALAANLIFVYEGSSKSFLKTLCQNWKIITAAFAVLSYIPFFAYLKWGRNFLYSENLSQETICNKLPENRYCGIIKEKSMWLWFFWYSFLLVNSLLVSLKAPKIISKINSELMNTFKDSNLDWQKLYICIFYVGCLAGMAWGKWAKCQYQRKPIVVLCCVLSLFFWLFVFAFAHIKNAVAATALIYISVFLFAFFAIGIQSVILYIPHEYTENHNSKRITIFYSYLWGLGYIVYTIYAILVASCMGKLDDTSNTNGHYIAAGLITLFVFLFALFSFFIKEPRPNYKFFPGLNQMSDLWRRLG